MPANLSTKSKGGTPYKFLVCKCAIYVPVGGSLAKLLSETFSYTESSVYPLQKLCQLVWQIHPQGVIP